MEVKEREYKHVGLKLREWPVLKTQMEKQKKGKSSPLLKQEGNMKAE